MWSSASEFEPTHLDPTAGAAAAIGEVVYANVFEGLTRIDRDATVQPALAERWDRLADGKTYTFALRRKGVPSTTARPSRRRGKGSSTRPRRRQHQPAEGPVRAHRQRRGRRPRHLKVTLKRPTGRSCPIWAGRRPSSSRRRVPPTTRRSRSAPAHSGSTVGKGASLTWCRTRPMGKPRQARQGDVQGHRRRHRRLCGVMSGDVDAYPLYPAPENSTSSAPIRASRSSSAIPRARRSSR